MRCLVKNLAMFGLGLYIYAGEDLPQVETPEPEKVPDKPVDKKTGPEKGTVEQSKTLPPNPEPAEGEKPGVFLQRRITEMKAEFENFDFLKIQKALIEGGVVPDIPSATMTMEQAKKAGINDSIIHVDFMVGAEDLSIDGIRPDGSTEPVFRNGTWA